MEIVHCADYATATPAMCKRIDVPPKKGTIAMGHQLYFDFARYEWPDAKPVEHNRQKVFHSGGYFRLELAKTQVLRHPARAVDQLILSVRDQGIPEAILI